MSSEKNNPYSPGRPKVTQDPKELPNEPGEYRLVDPNPGVVKIVVRTIQGKDPNIDHLGIASDLKNRVGPGHEKYDSDVHEIHYQVAGGEKNAETWKHMGQHESDSLHKHQPGLSDVNRGGAGRPPKWAQEDDDDDYDDDDDCDDDESTCPWCEEEECCLILEDDEYEGQRIYTCCSVYFDEDGDLWPEENPMGGGYCRCCGENQHANYCGKELCGGCCEGNCGENNHN